MGFKKDLEYRSNPIIEVGGSSSQPDAAFCPDTWNYTVVFEVADSRFFASARVKGALWCQLPSIKAIILVETDDEKQVITMTKVVPAFRNVGSASRYPREVGRVVVRPKPNTAGYELDPDRSQAITLACGDMTNEAPPAGKRDFVFDGEFFCRWAARVWVALVDCA